MNRRGNALLSAMWLCLVLAGLAAVMLDQSRMGLAASRWRLQAQREAWAAEACLAIMLAQVDSVAGATTGDVRVSDELWCRGSLAPAGSRVDLAHAPAWALLALLERTELVAALLDWQDPDSDPRPGGAERAWYQAHGRPPPRDRPVTSLAELALVRGFDDTVRARIRSDATVRSHPEPIALWELPLEVLEAAPWLTWEATASLRRLREAAVQPGSVEELAGEWAPEAGAHFLAGIAAEAMPVRVRSDDLILEVAAGAAAESLATRLEGTGRVHEGRLRLVDVRRW